MNYYRNHLLQKIEGKIVAIKILLPVFLLLILLLSSVLVTAQVTTETEYKYIKNLMKEIQEKGADPKRGYYVKDLPGFEFPSGNKIVAAELRREADSTIAGTYIKINVGNTFSGNGIFYFCIPSPNLESTESYGWDTFYTDLSNAGNTCKDIFLRWMAERYSIEKYYRNPPKKKVRTN